MLTPDVQAGDDVVPRLLLSGSEAAQADKDANKAPEPPRISSVFGTQPLKVYKLPFEDQYPSGPFERLDKHLFLF
ncbi:MAG: PQQ-dependent sugar dehydrogenase, partial [Methylophilus sp.]|nr:PQQ-dependent sugar dehydrogenase [Methylophilus sp.]